MDEAATAMTAELRDALAAPERRLIDPRSMPLRFTRLKAMGQSPAHCLQSFQDDRDDTLAMRLGRGSHALLFGQPVAVFDQPAKKGKGKAPRNGEAWNTFRSAHPFATILNVKEHAKATAIASAVKRNEVASRLLFSPGTLVESQIDWTWQGRRCQSTPDARSVYSLIDLKTTKCAEPERFARDAMYRGYHAQLAFYRLAVEATVGVKSRDAYIIAVESSPPFAVTVLQLTERALDKGEQLCRIWFERFRVCEDSNTWPGYCEAIAPFDVPDDDIGLIFGGGESSGEEAGDAEPEWHGSEDG